MRQSQYFLQTADRLRYLVALPTEASSLQAPRPVLCFLHGYDEGSPTCIEDALTRHGPLRSGGSVAMIKRFIIIAPQMPVRGDLWSGYAEDVQQIVSHGQKQYCGDPQRSYLSGFSFGANGVFDLALQQPGRWAALWAVDPTRIPVRDPQCPVWLSVGEIARSLKKGFIRTLALKKIETHAEGDRIIMDEGADHVGTATLAYNDERIYAWLLSKRI